MDKLQLIVGEAGPMGRLQFAAEVIKAVAWPIAGVVLALVFRRSIIELLGRINRAKVFSAELEFETQVARAAQSVQLPVTEPPPVTGPAITDQAVSDPRGAVLSAWRDVEIALREFAREKRIVYASTLLRPFSAVDALKKANALEPEYIELLEHLGELRNQAAHQKDFVPSTDSVALYLKLAEAFKAALKKAAG